MLIPWDSFSIYTDMRVLVYVLLTCLCWWLCGIVMASTWNDYKDAKPQDIVDTIIWRKWATEDGVYKDGIIKTKLDGVTNNQIFGAEHKLSWTLDSVRQNISFYLQWIAYLALSGAVGLIVYNGLRLVISPLSPDEASKVKTRIMYIALGIVVTTWFYFALKILLAIYYDIFAN